MRPVEFWAAVEGFTEAQEETIRVHWETARLVSYYAIAPHLKKGQNKGPKDLFELPWEVKVKKAPRKLTPEEVKYHLERMRRVKNWRTANPDDIHKLVN